MKKLTIRERTQQAKIVSQAIAKTLLKRKLKVVIEVLGGVAEVTKCPEDVEVTIIDHDNNEE